MYSFMCFFSKSEHKAKNKTQSKQTSTGMQTHTHAHTVWRRSIHTEEKMCDGNLNKFRSVVSKSKVRLDSEARREAGPEDDSLLSLR